MAICCEGRFSSPMSYRPEGGGELNFNFPAVMAFPSPPPSLRPTSEKEVVFDEEEDNKPQFDIWNSIQESKKESAPAALELPQPYVHPLMRRSSSMLSQKSMDVCTESLGSETGSDEFCEWSEYPDSDNDDMEDEEEDIDVGEEEGEYSFEYYGVKGKKRKELASVNYHCSLGKRSPTRAFPPPLPSISRRDGPCLHMKPQRKDGRLVVQAVPVPSQNYLHCQRQEGRLLLTFIEPAFEDIYPEDVRDSTTADEQMEQYELLPQEDEVEGIEEIEDEEGGEQDEEEMDDDRGGFLELEKEDIDIEDETEEEEVEVVDRGTVVEVKVSRQPQPQSGNGKVHRSSLVINKFVVGTPTATEETDAAAAMEGGENDLTTKADQVAPPAAATMEARNAAAAAEVDGWGAGRRSPLRSRTGARDDSRLQVSFTSKKLMNREALLYEVRRCSYPHRPLFIWETCCIATS